MKLFNKKYNGSLSHMKSGSIFRNEALKDAGILHQMAQHFENQFFESKQISKKFHQLGK